MNDFTKEELFIILRLIGTYEHLMKLNNMVLFEEEIAIQNKIQSMIDNYCEHKEIVTGAYNKIKKYD